MGSPRGILGSLPSGGFGVIGKPRVSVVVPCFQMGARLDETFESVLAQRYSNIELIVVNDGSEDGPTLEALQRARTAGATIIQQSNGGVGSALNTGIGASTGKYFVTLGDDIIDPPYIEEAVVVLESNPEVGVVYCNASFFGAVSGDWDLPEFSVKTQLFENCVFAPAVFRRQDYDAVGGFDSSLVGLEDYDFVTKVVSLGRDVRKLEGRYFHYRRGAKSLNDHVSEDRSRVVTAQAQIIRNNIDFYRDNADLVVEHVLDLKWQRDQFARERDKLQARYGWIERVRRVPSRVGSRVRSVLRRIG